MCMHGYLHFMIVATPMNKICELKPSVFVSCCLICILICSMQMKVYKMKGLKLNFTNHSYANERIESDFHESFICK